MGDPPLIIGDPLGVDQELHRDGWCVVCGVWCVVDFPEGSGQFPRGLDSCDPGIFLDRNPARMKKGFFTGRPAKELCPRPAAATPRKSA